METLMARSFSKGAKVHYIVEGGYLVEGIVVRSPHLLFPQGGCHPGAHNEQPELAVALREPNYVVRLLRDIGVDISDIEAYIMEVNSVNEHISSPSYG
ncbi:hypothetical protein GW930_03480 [Candidatus Saccharibacteria bacterium]|nr:hypothetical protein [Candidatus Saccharibacteria bacterium]